MSQPGAPRPEPARSTARAPAPRAGWRVLGFGRHPEVAAAIQARLRSLGYQATHFALTNDADGAATRPRPTAPAGAARWRGDLQRPDYAGVAIGGFINGQDPDQPPTEETTLWF